MNELVTIKIKSLIERAPKGWVFILAKEMGKKPSTIYSYANGYRAKKSIDERIKLKRLLTKIVENHEKKLLVELD